MKKTTISASIRDNRSNLKGFWYRKENPAISVKSTAVKRETPKKVEKLVLGEADRLEGALVIMLEKYANYKKDYFSPSTAESTSSQPKKSMINTMSAMETEMKQIATEMTSAGKPVSDEVRHLCSVFGAGWLLAYLKNAATIENCQG